MYLYTGANVDRIRPTVVAFHRRTGRPGLTVNTRIIAVMSEPIDPSSVSNGSIQLTPAAPRHSHACDRPGYADVGAIREPRNVDCLLGPGHRSADTACNTMAAANSGFTTGTLATPDTTPPVDREPHADAQSATGCRRELFALVHD